MEQLLHLLRSASQFTDSAQHRLIQQQLDSFHNIPEYASLLAYILNDRKEGGPVRQLAGIVLKNYMKAHWRNRQKWVGSEYVCQTFLSNLGDPSKCIRTTVGSCVTTVIRACI